MRSPAALRRRPASFQRQPLSEDRRISGLLSRSISSSHRRSHPPPTLSPLLSVCNGPGEEQEGREINKGTERETQEGKESRNWRAMEGADKRRRERQRRRKRRRRREMEARSLGRSQAALSASVAVQSGLPGPPPGLKTLPPPHTPSHAQHAAALLSQARVVPSSSQTSSQYKLGNPDPPPSPRPLNSGRTSVHRGPRPPPRRPASPPFLHL